MNKYSLKYMIITFFVIISLNGICQKATDIRQYNSAFSLYQDTISVDIKGDMTHALQYHDKFFILFKQRILKYGGHGKRWLYIFSDGKIERTLECPKKMDAAYWDFFVKNDSIILKQYMDDVHFYFDTQNFTWIEIDKADDLIFEDEKFYVYSLDFGEWGGKTWFKDKKTGIEYAIEVTTPLVNKIDTVYYLTTSFQVLKIENPLNLNKCDDDVTYENIETNGKYYSWYGEPIGFEIMYQDTTYGYFDFSYHPHIVSSFVWQNELIHIYETDTGTYIAKNNSIQPIQKIGEKLSFYDWYYSYRCKNLNRNNELLKFRTEDEQLFGLMNIVDNKIFVHYFVNRAQLKPKVLGTEKADTIFINRLNHILSGFHDLQLKDIDLLEQKWGGFDITPDRWENSKAYLIEEDSVISNSIHYLTTEENDMESVEFEWDETNSMHWRIEELKGEMFNQKLNFIENCLVQKLGKAIKNTTRGFFAEKIWETSDGLKIELDNHTGSNWIKLRIFEK